MTLEAGLLMPVLMLTVIGLLMMSIYWYQKGALFGEASRAAERAAYVWDNEAKDPVTGAFPIGRHDALYGDLWSEDWAGLIGLSGLTNVVWQSSQSEQPVSTAERKLYRSASVTNGRSLGQFSYSRSGIESSVQVQLQQPLRLTLPFTGKVERIHEGAEARIVNPADWIRSTNLLLDYWARWQAYRARSGSTDEPGGPESNGETPPEKPVIRSEAEAAAFLRELVGGRSVNLDTDHTGVYRHIDALDADGVAHEAKYTVNSTDAKEQLRKDVELMQSGAVKGVMWHFFRNQRTGKIDLTASLKRELERNGIIVVIHN